MSMSDDHDLILAAEDCPEDRFETLHTFSRLDERVIAKLVAHGPVLVRGGRGSGKSALMIEAARRMRPGNQNPGSPVGVYISLRHLELLKRMSGEYERALCEVISRHLRSSGIQEAQGFHSLATVNDLRLALANLSEGCNRRLVLLFDDAAHIGREASLSEFFDVFRTIASSSVSCKAAIYPGVTRFGTRFDVFNDATVVDVTRNEEMAGFDDLFAEIIQKRFGEALPEDAFSPQTDRRSVAAFLGQAVIGNMRAFVFACNALIESRGDGKVGLSGLSEIMLSLAANHFWPLLDELRPKLGIYEPMVTPAQKIAEAIFAKCGPAKDGARQTVTIHRDLTERLAKPFEMLEYTGFIAKREGSRSLKTGGRGPRFAVNLCSLLEKTPGSRLTKELMQQWTSHRLEPTEFHSASQELADIVLPELGKNEELGILREPIGKLEKSNA